MAITVKILNEVINIKNRSDYETMEAFFKTLPADHDRELVKSVCETYTRLLLSITPYKAKEFVEKNCARVTQKIMKDVNEKVIKKYTDGEYTD
jgi:leucyl-tRNA synthetase